MTNKDKDDDLKILVEIVSASNLKHPTAEESKSYDVCCTCLMSSTKVHSTQTICNTLNPIWTIKSDSLFVLETTTKELKSAEGLLFELDSVRWPTRECFGHINVPYDTIVGNKEKRLEFDLQQSNFSKKNGIRPVLALRFRQASEDDVEFMKNHSPNRESIEVTAEDLDEKKLGIMKANSLQKTLLAITSNISFQGNVTKFLVKPYPDPKRIAETKWLSQKELDDECLRPSQLWTQVGSGNLGNVFIEIIKCDNLPNLDKVFAMDTKIVSDPFVMIVLEDAVVKTMTVENCLSPRWMPWTKRAFSIPIYHPKSPILIGVFDEDHINSPMGRIVIDFSTLYSNTEYLLTYDLHADPNTRLVGSQGTLTIRLRVSWQNEWEKVRSQKVPRFLVNVKNKRDFAMLRYICKGEANIEKASIKAVSERAQELVSYKDNVLLAVDAVFRVILWRDYIHFEISRKHGIRFIHPLTTENESIDDYKYLRVEDDSIKVAMWFPIHSLFFWVGGIVTAENLMLLPTFICFGLTWILLSINYARCRHPNPWKRRKSFLDVLRLVTLNYQVVAQINKNEGKEESEEFEMLRALKVRRIEDNLSKVMFFLLQYVREYTKTDKDDIAIETEDNTRFLFDDKLYYIHLPLYYMCMMLRSLNALVGWATPKESFSFTVAIFSVGAFFLMIDWVILTKWLMRIFFWTLGPWMKVIDNLFIKYIYRSDRELRMKKQTSTTFSKKLNEVLQSNMFQNWRKKTIIAHEDALKLKDMRVYRFGRFSEVIPSSNPCQFIDVPLHESHAHPYNGKEFVEVEYELKGQKLKGTMIHTN